VIRLPSAVVIGGAFLYSLFGVSAFVGIACVPLTSPIGWWIAKRIYGEARTAPSSEQI
jgi:hypothetical protein